MISLFVYYAADNQHIYNELEKHLSLMRRDGLIQSWSDFSILPGAVIQAEREQMVAQAQIALLLISPDFLAQLAADVRYASLLTIMMERQVMGSLHVIPVLVCPVEKGWKQTSFGHLKAVPPGEKPITLWHNHDEAYVTVVEAVREVIEKKDDSVPPSQHPSASRQPQPIPGSPQIIQRVAADTESLVEQIKQRVHRAQAGVTLSVEATGHSTIRGVDQEVDNRES